MLIRQLLLCAALFLFHQAQATTNEIIIGFGEAYKPFAWNDHGVSAGIQADFVEEVLVNQLGLKIVRLACPWRRCQQLVKAGEIDGFFTVPTEEREAYTVKTAVPFYHTNFVMHTAVGNPHLAKLKTVKNIADIEKLPEIMHVNMAGSGWHKYELRNVKHRTEVQDALFIPKMLVQKRADLYIEQQEMFHYQARSLGLLDQIVTLQQPVMYKMPWHLFLSKQSPHVMQLDKINQRLQELQQSGELEKIRQTIFKKHGVL